MITTYDHCEVKVYVFFLPLDAHGTRVMSWVTQRLTVIPPYLNLGSFTIAGETQSVNARIITATYQPVGDEYLILLDTQYALAGDDAVETLEHQSWRRSAIPAELAQFRNSQEI